jgi:glycosidase
VKVTGGRAFAVDIVDTTGIDAALGIDDIQGKLEFLAKGKASPGDPRSDEQKGYFDLFINSLLDDKATHQWYSKHIVVIFDDHDQISMQHKFRFCGDSFDSYKFLPIALGLNLTSAGIPCIYYGTEQAFNGGDDRTDKDTSYSDTFLRECMFGGAFGSFQSKYRHFFNEEHGVYQFISEVCTLRRQHIALCRGRQYLREVSGTGQDGDFFYPQPVEGELRWVVAWSRIFADSEYLCAINTDANQPLTIWATVDNSLNPPGGQMTCLLSTDSTQIGKKVHIEMRNGSAIKIDVPKTGFVVYH